MPLRARHRYTAKRNLTKVDDQVAANMRRFRIAAGVTQEDLAAAVGVSFQQIQKYEKGHNRISIGRLVSVCEVLGVSLAEMVAAPEAPRLAAMRRSRYRTVRA